MATSYETCPQSMIYPTVFGLRASSSDYSFTEWSVQMYNIDFNEKFVVSAGIVQVQGGTGFWPINDIAFVNCEGTACSERPDWDTSTKLEGLLYFFEHENYSSHKSYLFSNAEKNIIANRVHIAQAAEDHQVMTLARDNWGINLTSAETIKGIGAVSVAILNSAKECEELVIR